MLTDGEGERQEATRKDSDVEGLDCACNHDFEWCRSSQQDLFIFARL